MPKGIYNHYKIRGKASGMLGKHHSEETKNKMSRSKKGITKKENPNLIHFVLEEIRSWD